MVRTITVIVLALTVLGLASGSEGQTYGNWTVSTTTPDVTWAAVLNDSGHGFGQFCYPNEGTCYWLIGLTLACKPGDRYPVLVNSDNATLALEVVCLFRLGNSPRHAYAFTNFDQIDNLVRDTRRLALAISLVNDEFLVIRFNLHGAEAALSVMRAAAEKRMKPATRDTRDRRL